MQTSCKVKGHISALCAPCSGVLLLLKKCALLKVVAMPQQRCGAAAAAIRAG
jgi:hypothetical protein